MARMMYCAAVRRIADTFSSRPNIDSVVSRSSLVVRYPVHSILTSGKTGCAARGFDQRPTTNDVFLHVLCLNLSSTKYSTTPTTAFANPASTPRLQLQFSVK